MEQRFNRRDLLKAGVPAALIPRDSTAAAERGPYEVGAYYFPGYHPDPRTEANHGRGWTEWRLVQQARPRFSGHQQPKQPAWGYEDESDPRVFARKIQAAADHNLTHFLFDWYWYEGAPFLNRSLEEGYLKAPNNDRLKFALMWANHDWLEIQPALYNVPPALRFPGGVDAPTFEKLTDYVIGKYFTHPSYWKIDGAPYFSVYELFRLIAGLGGLDAAGKALSRFRDKTRQAGFPDLHLNAIVWGIRILPGESQVENPKQLLERLGFNSTTSYVWIHHVPLKQFPVTPYREVASEAAAHWRQAAGAYGLPIYRT